MGIPLRHWFVLATCIVYAVVNHILCTSITCQTNAIFHRYARWFKVGSFSFDYCNFFRSILQRGGTVRGEDVPFTLGLPVRQLLHFFFRQISAVQYSNDTFTLIVDITTIPS